VPTKGDYRVDLSKEGGKFVVMRRGIQVKENFLRELGDQRGRRRRLTFEGPFLGISVTTQERDPGGQWVFFTLLRTFCCESVSRSGGSRGYRRRGEALKFPGSETTGRN